MMLQILLLLSVRLLLTKAEMEGKIVGGSFANIHDFPHSVYLAIRCNEQEFVCGSSTLNQYMLLTAAHCYIGFDCRLVHTHALAGHHDIRKATALRNVSRYMVHEKYKASKAAYDIALVRLNKRLPLGNNIMRVFVPSVWPTVKKARVAGWGCTKLSKPRPSQRLKSITQFIKDYSTCKELLYAPAGVICCDSYNGRNSLWRGLPYKGDSGSGLVTKNYQLIGIVSYGFNYTSRVFYTNTTYFSSWIEEGIKRLYCS